MSEFNWLVCKHFIDLDCVDLAAVCVILWAAALLEVVGLEFVFHDDVSSASVEETK